MPRMIACLRVPRKPIHVGVKTLLIHSGCANPRALAFSLMVAGTSHHRVGSAAAADLLKAMRYHPERLVEQAELMVREHGRVVFLRPGLWHEGLAKGIASVLMSKTGSAC